MGRANRGEWPAEFSELAPQPQIDKEKVFQGKVMLLIDRACGFGLRDYAPSLEALPRRVLEGENTRGAITYGEVGRVVLPHSRVWVTLSTMRVKFRDKRDLEKKGFTPNIRVDEGRDALDSRS